MKYYQISLTEAELEFIALGLRGEAGTLESLGEEADANDEIKRKEIILENYRIADMLDGIRNS